MATLLQPVQWVAAQEITQIQAPFQQETGTPGRESTIQLKEKKCSEAGSQVSRLGGFHPHRDKQNGNLKCSRWRVSLRAQLNSGWCSSVGEGHSPLPRQPAPTEVHCHC